MYPRVNYEMTEEDLNKILDACKPVPCISFDGISSIGGSQQDNANRAWQELGKKMGFEWDTVQPIEGKGNRYFSAIPSETALQREERELKEAQEANQKDIERLNQEIADLETKLKAAKQKTITG